MSEIADGYELSAEAVEHPAVRALTEMSWLLVAFDNDLYSYHRENVLQGNGLNAVDVVAREQGRTVAEAVDTVVAMRDRVMCRFLALGDEVAHARQREAVRVERKDAPVVHVVNVSPERLERDLGQAVVLHHLGQLKGVAVAVAALVQAKGPVRHLGRQPDHGGVLARNVGGRRAGEKVKVEHAAEHVVLEVLRVGVLVGAVDDDVHAVGVEQKDAMAGGRRGRGRGRVRRRRRGRRRR